MTIAELRKTRMAQGLSLTEISRRTRIGVAHLRKIEDGDFRSLPPGFYARAFVRAYVEAIGVDADVVLGELADELPATQAALAPHPESSARQPGLPWTDAAVLIPDARMQVLKQLLERHNDEVAGRSIESPARIAPGRGARRFAAATLDGFMLAMLYLAILGVTAAQCGVGLTTLVREAGPALFTVLGLITVMYVLMMGGVAGKTIGAMLLDVTLVEHPSRPLDLGAIARRSVDCVRADVRAATDVASLVDVLLGRLRKAA
jgi:transcriptional regulator with XRE-family HTH domain